MAKKTLKQRMLEKKTELKKKASGGGFILRQKEEGTLRMRIMNCGEDNEFAFELTTFWLGMEQGEVISPATFGEPCACMEKYLELKQSSDEDDIETAKKLVPRKKYVIPQIMFKDDKGKEVDEENSERLFQIAGGTYQDIIDLYLDDDEWGDMTDPEEGYDIKITRSGKGKNDTKYTVSPCKNTSVPKAYAKKVIDLEEMVRAKVHTYEETVEKLNSFLGTPSESNDEDDRPRKKSKRNREDKPVKKKRRNRDI